VWQNATPIEESTYAFNPSNPLNNKPLIFGRGKTLEKSDKGGKVANSALSQFLACSVASLLIV
jgi:hypothetical protein